MIDYIKSFVIIVFDIFGPVKELFLPSVLLALSAGKVIIAAVIVLIQYILALIAFVKISKINLTLKKLLIFNFLIIFVFYLGPIFAIIYATRKSKTLDDIEQDKNQKDN